MAIFPLSLIYIYIFFLQNCIISEKSEKLEALVSDSEKKQLDTSALRTFMGLLGLVHSSDNYVNV